MINVPTTSCFVLLGMTPESESPDPDVKDRPDHDGLLDYLLMGGSLTLVLGTIITVITSYYLCYYRKKKRGKMQNVDYNKKKCMATNSLSSIIYFILQNTDLKN